ncbi:MAG: penicillin-binding protein 2 [Clostridia bacterium]|nr:penicillin-binding protein 2 [Clostridia bacterium]
MKRLKIFVIFMIFAAMALTFRLAYICIVKKEDYSQKAVGQRVERLKYSGIKGVIYDRNMISITDYNNITVKDGKLFFQGNKTNNLLSHVIGYVSDDGKGSGIIGAFADALSNGEKAVSCLKGPDGKVPDGYLYQRDSRYSGISLTIDYHMQKIAENAMDKYGIKGAAVVADCKTGEILAMASRPNFDKNNIAKYLNGTEGELVNKAISAYNPGSVFKIAVAAAALETSLNEERTYSCSGETEIDGRAFACHKEDGHGTLNVKEAFANSCNSAFYSIGIETGADMICKYARLFGFGKEVLKINGICEDEGVIPSGDYTDAQTANISIGQGDVMVTPLQVADMMCTICNGGIRNQMKIIRGFVDADGKCRPTDPVQTGRVISKSTADKIISMMIEAVKSGTGIEAQIEKYGAGGKTGSAETGWEKDGELMTQGWFAGFFPAEEPKYVCVVVAENGKSGSKSACPVFRQIGEDICNINVR